MLPQLAILRATTPLAWSARVHCCAFPLVGVCQSALAPGRENRFGALFGCLPCTLQIKADSQAYTRARQSNCSVVLWCGGSVTTAKPHGGICGHLEESSGIANLEEYRSLTFQLGSARKFEESAGLTKRTVAGKSFATAFERMYLYRSTARVDTRLCLMRPM